METLFFLNKIVLQISIDSGLLEGKPQLLLPLPLVLTVHHYHYPCTWSEEIWNSFKFFFPSSASARHIRLSYRNRVLSPDLPIGLQIQDGSVYADLVVTLVPIGSPKFQDTLRNSWKQAYEIIDAQNKGCEPLRFANKEDIQARLKKYKEGGSTFIRKENVPRFIALRIFVDGIILERKEKVSADKLVVALIEGILNPKGERELRHQYQYLSHGQLLDMRLTVKQFLEEWHYNDGFCYVKAVLPS